MVTRRSTSLIAGSACALLLCLAPAIAIAGTDAPPAGGTAPETSPVDTVLADTADNGKVDSTSSDAVDTALDSPTMDQYESDNPKLDPPSGGGDAEAPPPGDPDCDSSSSSTSPASGSGSTSCDPPVDEDPPTRPETCPDGSGKGTDDPTPDPPTGTNPPGDAQPPANDDGHDHDHGDVAGGGAPAAGDGGGTGDGSPVPGKDAGDSCKNGGPDDPPVVDGGGDNPETFKTNTAAGGGAPELPFTGLPIGWVVSFGLALLLTGMSLFIRAKRRARLGGGHIG